MTVTRFHSPERVSDRTTNILSACFYVIELAIKKFIGKTL